MDKLTCTCGAKMSSTEHDKSTFLTSMRCATNSDHLEYKVFDPNMSLFMSYMLKSE